MTRRISRRGLRPGSDRAAARDVTVMLVDLRWQHAGPGPLPHDLLHALDRFGKAVADVASQHGGTPIAPQAGDRWTLLFGIELAPADSMRQGRVGTVARQQRGLAAVRAHTGSAVCGESAGRTVRTGWLASLPRVSLILFQN